MTESKQKAIIVAMSSSLGIFIMGLAVYLLVPHEISTKVTSIKWTYTIHLRQKTLRTDEGWGRPWSDAFDIHCKHRFYGMEDCFCSTTCTPSSNGSESCRRSCSSCPEYRDYCHWKYWDWPIVKTAQTTGTTHSVVWADLLPGADQRIDKLQEYEILFTPVRGEQQTFRYNNNKSLTEFNKFTPNDYWVIKIRKIGTVEPIRKLTAERSL